MKTNEKTAEAQGVETKKREKTVTLTVSQLIEIYSNEDLGRIIIDVVNGSDGNMKGNMAFAIAKTMLKQQEKGGDK